MQFKDLSDETLQRLGDRIIRNASARIRRQVPQRGKNPYATGKLARSLSFGWSNTFLAFTVTYEVLHTKEVVLTSI